MWWRTQAKCQVSDVEDSAGGCSPSTKQNEDVLLSREVSMKSLLLQGGFNINVFFQATITLIQYTYNALNLRGTLWALWTQTKCLLLTPMGIIYQNTLLRVKVTSSQPKSIFVLSWKFKYGWWLQLVTPILRKRMLIHKGLCMVCICKQCYNDSNKYIFYNNIIILIYFYIIFCYVKSSISDYSKFPGKKLKWIKRAPCFYNTYVCCISFWFLIILVSLLVISKLH